jgi:hypothetical protein
MEHTEIREELLGGGHRRRRLRGPSKSPSTTQDADRLAQYVLEIYELARGVVC